MDLAELEEPSLEKFLQICDEFRKREVSNIGTSQDLEVYAKVLSEKLIPTFGLHSKGRKGLSMLFESPRGLSCLLSELKRAPLSEVKYIWVVLGDILTKTNLNTLLDSAYTETAQLIWGSRILNITSSRMSNDIEEFKWLGIHRQYADWLARRMISDNVVDPKLFDRGVKLGAPTVFIRPFMKNCGLLEKLFVQLRQGQQEFLLTHAVFPELPKNPAEAGILLMNMKVCPHLLAQLCYKIPADVEIIRAAVVVARESKGLGAIVGNLLSEWSNKFFIDTSALINQQALTQYLIAASTSLTTSEAAKYTHSPDLNGGVSTRLASTSNSIRELGTLVAETYAKRSGASLKFELSYTGYPWWIGWDSIESPPANSPRVISEISDQDFKTMRHILGPLADVASDSDDEKQGTVDSDDEESDEEVDPPYFLKDLILYLRSEKYPEVLSGLENGERLVSRKAHFGSEVSQYAEELLLVACGLNDKYSIKKFSEMRQGILNSILAADPTQTRVAMRMFVTGDWSLAQRQSLLAAVAYAAHDLSQGQPKSEHMQLLPSQLHALFISSKDSTNLAADNANNHEVELPVSKNSQALAKNRLSKAVNLFFFPVLAAQPPSRKSAYDAIVYAQWLRTLGLLVAQSYPSQFIPAMISEMWPLLTGFLHHWPQHEHIVIEALYSTMSLILDVGKSLIMQNYRTELGSVFDLLIDSLDQVFDSGPQVEQAGRRTAAQLAEMIEHLNKKIFSPN